MKKLLLLLALLVPSAHLSADHKVFVKAIKWVDGLSNESQERVYRDLANLYNQGHFTLDYIKTLVEHDYFGHPLCSGQLHQLGLAKLLKNQKNRIQEQINVEKLNRAQNSAWRDYYVSHLIEGGIITSLGLCATACLPRAKRFFENRMTSFLCEYEKSYCRTLAAQYRLAGNLADSAIPLCCAATIAAVYVGVGVCGMTGNLKQLYTYYTYLGNKEKEIKVIDAMITQLRGIENIA